MREPFFWLSGKLAYAITASPAYSLLLMDVSILMIYRSALKKDLSFSALFLLFTFPLVLGFTNIYRQLFATILILKGFSVEFERSNKINIFFIAACFSHLASIPLLIFYYFVKIFRYNYKLALILIITFALPFIMYNVPLKVVQYVGGTDTRNNMEFLYVILFLFLLFFTFSFARYAETVYYDVLFACVLFFLFGIFLLLVAPSSTGTRVIMLSIVVVSFVFVKLPIMNDVQRHNKILVSALYLLLLIVPSFIFSSVWHLVFGYEL